MVRLSSFATTMVLAALMLTACGSSSNSASSATTTKTTSAARATTTPADGSSTTSTAAGGGASTTTVGSSSLNAPAVVTGSTRGVTATMHVGGHHPHVNQTWPLSFLVTAAGAPARASVSYEYVFGGQVVARRSHYRFVGHFSDTSLWPAASVGYPLTFRAVVVSGNATLNLDYAVQVVR